MPEVGDVYRRLHADYGAVDRGDVVLVTETYPDGNSFVLVLRTGYKQMVGAWVDKYWEKLTQTIGD
jgi:hypothetical protein